MIFLYTAGALLFLAVLPISETIALRNLVLLSLTLACMWIGVKKLSHEGLGMGRMVHALPLLWWTWVVYLLLFPLWAAEPSEAWRNLAGHWGESILAWCAGFALFFVAKGKRPGLLIMAFTASAPVWIHLGLVLMVWLGLFQNSIVSSGGVPWSELGHHLSSLAAWPGIQPFPWGFRGIEPMHGNIGYPACVGIAFFAAYGFTVNSSKTRSKYLVLALGLMGCFASVLIANSRGAFLYGLLILLAVGLLSYLLRTKNPHLAQTGSMIDHKKTVFFFVLILIGLGALQLLVRQSVERDPRWGLMVDRVQVGLMAQDPVDVLCHNVSKELEQKIRQKFGSRGDAYVEDLLAGLRTQDGGRILLMRAGWQLAVEHPLGLDGSRLSYQKLIEQRCGGAPALHFSHAHQGWLDTAMAIGWVGVGILFLLYAHLMLIGWRARHCPEARPWAVGLLLVAAFWLLRGFADSVYREHFLQIQAFVLAYLYLSVRANSRIKKS